MLSYAIIYASGCCEENEAKFINVDNLNENEVEYDDGDSDDSVSDDDDDDDEEDDDIEVYQLVNEKKELEQVLEIPVSIKLFLKFLSLRKIEYEYIFIITFATVQEKINSSRFVS